MILSDEFFLVCLPRYDARLAHRTDEHRARYAARHLLRLSHCSIPIVYPSQSLGRIILTVCFDFTYRIADDVTDLPAFGTQGVALTGRNRTGPPCSVGRPTAHAPGGRPVRPPAALQTTTTDDRRQPAKQYWPIRRASNKSPLCNRTLAMLSGLSAAYTVHWWLISRFLFISERKQWQNMVYAAAATASIPPTATNHVTYWRRFASLLSSAQRCSIWQKLLV